jgi:hypothetical protein
VSARGLVLAALLAGLVAGCGVPVDQTPRDLDRPGPATGSNAPADDGFGTMIERLYLVRDGALTRVARRGTRPSPPQQLLAELLAGPTKAEQEDGFTSALSTMPVLGMTVVARRAIIEVGERPDDGARSDEMLAYGQIVCTLTSQSAEVGTVSFTSGGRPLGVPRGDNSLSIGDLTSADYATLIDP